MNCILLSRCCFLVHFLCILLIPDVLNQENLDQSIQNSIYQSFSLKNMIPSCPFDLHLESEDKEDHKNDDGDQSLKCDAKGMILNLDMSLSHSWLSLQPVTVLEINFFGKTVACFSMLLLFMFLQTITVRSIWLCLNLTTDQVHSILTFTLMLPR